MNNTTAIERNGNSNGWLKPGWLGLKQACESSSYANLHSKMCQHHVCINYILSILRLH